MMASYTAKPCLIPIHAFISAYIMIHKNMTAPVLVNSYKNHFYSHTKHCQKIENRRLFSFQIS